MDKRESKKKTASLGRDSLTSGHKSASPQGPGREEREREPKVRLGQGCKGDNTWDRPYLHWASLGTAGVNAQW
jgi:hypothetical protein